MKFKPQKIVLRKNKKLASEIVSKIRSGSAVLLYGPAGTGKSTIIKETAAQLEEAGEYRCLNFDLEDGFEKGAFAFYTTIIETITGKRQNIIWESDISNDFIQRLESGLRDQSQKLVLFFDNFRAEKRDFYDHFSMDFRKIYITGKKRAGAELSRLRLIFAGSFFGREWQDTSPLWNVTENIHTGFLDPDDAKEAVGLHFAELEKKNPDNKLVEFVYECTNGHLFLSRELVRFLIKTVDNTDTFQGDFAKETIMKGFIDHVWNTLYPSKNSEVSQKIKRHFTSAISYLETDSDILKLVFNLLEDAHVFAPVLPKIDKYTVTGFLRKEKGEYRFSNIIYEKFYRRLLENHRGADFCLFHATDDELWKQAEIRYMSLLAKGKRRERPEPVAPGKLDFRPFVFNTAQRLRNHTDSASVVSDMIRIYSLILELPSWGVFRIAKKDNYFLLGGEDEHFDRDYFEGERLTNSATSHIRGFIDRAIKKNAPMLDWTGRWLAVPVYVNDDFRRILIARLNEGQKVFFNRISFFFTQTISIYFSMLSWEYSMNEMKLLKKKLSDRQEFNLRRHKDNLIMLWKTLKLSLELNHISRFNLYEIRNNGEVYISKSKDEEPNLTVKTRNIDEYPVIKKAKEKISSELIVYEFNDNETNSCFLGAQLKWGFTVFLQYFFENEDVKKRHQMVGQIFHTHVLLLRHAMDNFREIQVLKRSILTSDEYTYLVGLDGKIMVMNNRMEQLIKLLEPQFGRKKEETPHYHDIDRFFEDGNDYVNTVFGASEPVRAIRNFKCDKHNMVLSTAFKPVFTDRNDQTGTVAVAVFMNDITDDQHLLHALEKLESNDSFSMDNFIMDTLKGFGFERVFSFRPLPGNPTIFQSEDYRGEIAESKGKEFKDGATKIEAKDITYKEGNVTVFHRRKMENTNLLEFFKRSFQNSPIEFTPSYTCPESKKGHPRVDIWVSLPIFQSGKIYKMYSLDNHFNYERNKEKLTIPRLVQLGAFARFAGQILTNARSREYLKKFQAMLTHGTMESLQIMRNYLYPVIKQEKKSVREEYIYTADANLEIVQNALGSLLTIERGPGRINKNKIEINETIANQLKLFKAYAMESTMIHFDIALSKKPIFCITDETVLLQILYNIVGNSIRHLWKIKDQTEKKILINSRKENKTVTVDIADNGKGLPPEVREFFQEPFSTNMVFPTGGLGLGFSRELADMLGGELRLLSSSPYFNSGSTFRLTLKCGDIDE